MRAERGCLCSTPPCLGEAVIPAWAASLMGRHLKSIFFWICSPFQALLLSGRINEAFHLLNGSIWLQQTHVVVYNLLLCTLFLTNVSVLICTFAIISSSAFLQVNSINKHLYATC